MHCFRASGFDLWLEWLAWWILPQGLFFQLYQIRSYFVCTVWVICFHKCPVQMLRNTRSTFHKDLQHLSYFFGCGSFSLKKTDHRKLSFNMQPKISINQFQIKDSNCMVQSIPYYSKLSGSTTSLFLISFLWPTCRPLFMRLQYRFLLKCIQYSHWYLQH